MRRVVVLTVILAVVLPAVFASAASFNVSYSGGTVFVVPIEDVVTERQGAPTATATLAPSAMTFIDETEKAGASAASEPTRVKATATPSAPATPTPRPLPKVPQVPGSSGARTP